MVVLFLTHMLNMYKRVKICCSSQQAAVPALLLMGHE